MWACTHECVTCGRVGTSVCLTCGRVRMWGGSSEAEKAALGQKRARLGGQGGLLRVLSGGNKFAYFVPSRGELSGLGSRVSGSGFRVWGLGFRAWNVGLWA